MRAVGARAYDSTRVQQRQVARPAKWHSVSVVSRQHALEHMEAARERPAGLKKASSARKQRARKAAAAQYKVRHTGSQGSLVEIGRVLYCVNGWNQLPVELLRKRWMRGRSRALSAQERLLVNSILLAGAAEPGSDEEPDDCAGTWARAT